MFEHQRRAADKLVEALSPDPSIVAIITAGSVAQGTARESSDLDVYIVATDESFEERRRENKLSYINHEVCDYPDGYVDGKIINLRFLTLAVQQASEPTRASFIGSQVLFSRIPGLEDTLRLIPVYPEHNRERNLRDFYAQVVLYAHYFANEAVKKNNPYLLAHSASSIVLFGGRFILAYNRILFPCHKGLMAAVESAPLKPDHFAENANELLAAPTPEKCAAFADMLLSFHDPGITSDQAVTLFVENNEWNWIDREPPVQDR